MSKPIKALCQTTALPFAFDAIFPNFMVCTETFMLYRALKGFQANIVKRRCHHVLFKSLVSANFLIADIRPVVHLQRQNKRYCYDKRSHVHCRRV